MNQSLVKRLVAEAVGTGFLLAAVVGFVGKRVAIIGGPALKDVHDIDVGTLPAAGFDDLG